MVIIGIYLNDPIERHECVSYFDEFNIHEAIVSTHKGQSISATNLLNHSNYPIDGIWCSLGLKLTKEGYFKFREGILSDHKVLRWKFRLIDTFGSSDKIHKKVLQLKSNDSREVAKYISKTNKRLQKEQCMEKMEKLQCLPSGKFIVTHQK